MDRWVNNLIANLYFAEPGMRRPIVLTTSLYVQIYLKGLLLLRIASADRSTEAKE